MLNALGLENSRKNEETLFVKVELEPEKGEWWTNPETWKFSIKQDMVPEWFHDNEEHYRNEFKKVMKEWWNEHVFVDKRIEILTDDNYRLKRCVVNKLSGDAQVNIDETIIKKMCDNSAVGLMDEYSIVQQMSDNARIGMMMNCCIVGRMEGLSFINTMLGSSMVQEMHDNSSIREMYDTATVCYMYESSKISSMNFAASAKKMFGNSRVEEVTGKAVVQEMWESAFIKKLSFFASATNIEDSVTFFSKERKQRFKVKYQSIISND